jgi:hypothetical protein
MARSMREWRQRSRHFLGRLVNTPAWEFKRCVAEPRQPQGRRGPFQPVRRTLVWGVLTNRARLRQVEPMRESAGSARIPDSPRYDFGGQGASDAGAERRTPLQAPVRSDGRSTSLEPGGCPCGVAAVDHQTWGSGPGAHAHAPAAPVVPAPGRPA